MVRADLDLQNVPSQAVSRIELSSRARQIISKVITSLGILGSYVGEYLHQQKWYECIHLYADDTDVRRL